MVHCAIWSQPFAELYCLIFILAFGPEWGLLLLMNGPNNENQMTLRSGGDFQKCPKNDNTWYCCWSDHYKKEMDWIYLQVIWHQVQEKYDKDNAFDDHAYPLVIEGRRVWEREDLPSWLNVGSSYWSWPAWLMICKSVVCQWVSKRPRPLIMASKQVDLAATQAYQSDKQNCHRSDFSQTSQNCTLLRELKLLFSNKGKCPKSTEA